MKQFGLGKAHKLCSRSAIDRLFSRTDAHTAIAYPLRAVWGDNATRTAGEQVQFLISIPKKRLRHAVDRVAMRRRVREAYRLNRATLACPAPGRFTDIAFIYIADCKEPYAKVERAVQRLLDKAFKQQS